MKLAILDDYQGVALSLGPWHLLKGRCHIEVLRENLSVEQAAGRLQEFDIVCAMRERLAFPRELLEALPRLKLIVMTGTNARALDLEAATECGVVVCHTGGGGTDSTAELAWGLILALARHIPSESAGMRAGLWQRTLGSRLGGRTLGLLGLGKIGRRMALIGRAFDMKVVAWSQNLRPEDAESVGVTYVDKGELFASADVLSVHLVLGERTRGLVGAPELARLKPGAWVINTSRGPIIDEAALLVALQERRLGGAGLDVFGEEPLPTNHPLRALDNVVLTPHLGYVVREAYERFFQDSVEDVLAYLDGDPIRLLNPQVYNRAPLRAPPGA